LYSLGEEKTVSEVNDIISKYGKPGSGIPYDGFREFMIGLLGDSDTKDEILSGFFLINKGDIAILERLELVMNEHDLEYFQKTAPQVKGGYDYRKWTDDVFSR